jgi:tetratricopeptide (TPR) repeat protein
MKVDPRRDHSLVIPRPDLSLAEGTPNPCVSCHQGKADQWAAETMDQWYGQAWRSRPTDIHAFAAAWRGDPAAVPDLVGIAADPKQAGIVRGSALAELDRLGGPAALAALKAHIADGDPLVRLGIADGAAALDPAARLATIAPLLRDPMRAVRIAAVMALEVVPRARFSAEDGAAFDRAVQDFIGYAAANGDSAEAQGTLGLMWLGQGHAAPAEAAFLQAVRLDPSAAGARINLAEFFRVTGRNAESEAAYAAGVAAAPDQADLRYGHALALVRLHRLTDAIDELRQAVRLAPDSTRYAMTLAIALDSAGQSDDAFGILTGAATRDRSDPDLLGTLVNLGLKLGRYRETLPFAEALARLDPADRNVAAMVARLRDMAGKAR